MFFGVWWESVIKPFLQQLWIQWLKEEKDFYGYPLSIGAAEVTMMDLTNAYMHLSAMWSPAEINPIMEIRWPNNNLLYKKEVDRQSEVIPLGVAYILRTILSDNSNMPANWASLFTAPGKIKFATKTGTTNIVKGKEKLPRDGWLMSYTPSKVLAIWAWNTDGSAMNKNAYGWFISSPTRKSFIEKLVDQGYLENETPPRTEVKEVVIAKTSGKLVSNTTPLFLSQRTLAYLKTAPTEIDTNAEEIDIDKMCNGLPSELTPPKDIAKAWFIKPESILPDKRDVEDIKERRTTTWIEKMSQERDVSIVVEQLTWSCEARETQFASWDMNIDLMKPKNEQTIGQNFSVRYQASASIPVSTIKILLWETELKTITYKKDTSVSDIVNVAIPESIPDGPYTLKIIGIDHEWYVTTKTIAVTVKRQEDTTPPYLMEEKVQIQATNDPNSYKVIMLFADDDGIITQWSIEQSGEIIKSFTENATFIETDDLENPLTRVVMDNANNTGSWTIERSSYRVIPLADDQ